MIFDLKGERKERFNCRRHFGRFSNSICHRNLRCLSPYDSGKRASGLPREQIRERHHYASDDSSHQRSDFLNSGLLGPTSGDPHVMHIEVVVSLAIQEIDPSHRSIIIRDEPTTNAKGRNEFPFFFISGDSKCVLTDPNSSLAIIFEFVAYNWFRFHNKLYLRPYKNKR